MVGELRGPGSTGAVYQLYHGDCLDTMPTLEAGSVDVGELTP